MRLIAKAVIVAATTGAAAMFTAPAASSQTEISTTTTIDYDIAVLAVSMTLGGNAFAATEPDTGVVADVTLPVEQHLVTAQNTETGYSVELLPDNGNETTATEPAAQPLDASADGAVAGSPDVLSGNTIQVPIHLPLNLCGNTIDIVGLLNPTFGNTCVND